jgi:uncharacterized membrane protein YphA (DoxX/SURF4 family)
MRTRLCARRRHIRARYALRVPNSTIASASTTASWRGTPWRDWVGLVARVVLGIVMIVAGALKVTNLPSSVLAVRAYKLLQYDLAGAVGYALPFIEITVGLLLVLGVFTRVAAAVNGLLMVAFIIGISWAWAHGYSLDCGCFGGGGEIERAKALASYPWEIARDIGLLALAVWLVVRPTTPYSLENRLFGPVTVSDDDLDEELHS